MKITNDILKDYFYDKCSHEEEIEIQKWLTENDNNLMDQSFREIISEIQIEDRELSQKAFQKFQKAIQPKQVRILRPRLQHSIRWMQRVAAVLFIPLLFLAGYLLLDKKANTHWNDITVPHGMHQTLLPTSQKIKEKSLSVESSLPMWQRTRTSLLSFLPVTSMCRYWVQSSISVPTRILRR